MLGRKEWRVFWGPLCWPHRACANGLPFLESKVKTQGNWLSYTLCIFTASTLWMALPSWITGSYLDNPQNKVRAAVNASSLSPPRKESWFWKTRPGIFIFSLRRGGNGCGLSGFTNHLPDDRVLGLCTWVIQELSMTSGIIVIVQMGSPVLSSSGNIQWATHPRHNIWGFSTNYW